MRVSRYGIASLLIPGNSICTTTFAADFYISEVGTPGSLGSGAVINPTNTYTADAAWTNPAGMTGLDDDAILAGLTIATGEIKFDSDIGPAGDDDGNGLNTALIPSFFYVRKLSEDARFGFSVVAPLGGGFDFGDDFVGRYVVTKTSLEGVGFTPSFAYRVNERLSVGAGLSVVYTRFEQDIALNQPGFEDGKIKMEDLEDWGTQGILSLTYELSSRSLLGLVYRSEADTELSGDIKVENVQGEFSARRDLDVDWKNPQWLELGLRLQLTDDTTLFFNLGWQEWSAFSDNRLEIDTTDNTVVNLDRKFNNIWHAGIAIWQALENDAHMTLGLAYESSPVDDEDRTFDLPFDEVYKLAASYSWRGDEQFDYSVASTVYFYGDAAIDQTQQGVRTRGRVRYQCRRIFGCHDELQILINALSRPVNCFSNQLYQPVKGV